MEPHPSSNQRNARRNFSSAVRAVPVPVRKDDTLGVPADHRLNDRLQLALGLSECQAHIAWHLPLRMLTRPSPIAGCNNTEHQNHPGAALG
jgi:hypothetical protein